MQQANPEEITDGVPFTDVGRQPKIGRTRFRHNSRAPFDAMADEQILMRNNKNGAAAILAATEWAGVGIDRSYFCFLIILITISMIDETLNDMAAV